jgi:hypothetical protein
MAKVEPSAKDKPRKFEHIYKDDDGCESIWKYDLDKFPNGPISVEHKYPPHYEKKLKAQQKEAKLAKSQSTLEKAKAANKNDKSNRKYW